MKDTKAHTQYKLNSGTAVVGVTTVLQLLAKPALVEWAYKCGCQGIDIHKIREQATDIGSLTHYLILCELKGQTPDVSTYSQKDYETARNALKSYHAWRKANTVEPIAVETPMVSEKWGYGGTFDLYASVNGMPTVIDFKTSTGLWAEYSYQIGAYYELIHENLGIAPQGKLIRINKGNNDDFEVKTVTPIEQYFNVFKHLLRVYTLQRELT